MELVRDVFLVSLLARIQETLTFCVREIARCRPMGLAPGISSVRFIPRHSIEERCYDE